MTVPLTPRQLQVARLLRGSRSAAEIAETLGISTGTVKALAARVYRVLGLRGRAELRGLDLTTYARRRPCALEDCGRPFSPRRRDQRFHAAPCARKFARRSRARRRQAAS